jgi:hypothetical protein
MSKTDALRTELSRLLETVASNVYFQQKPDRWGYPYVAYEMDEMSHADGKTLYQLEINVVDQGRSTSTAETMSDDIQTLLHKYYYLGAGIQFSCYKNQRKIIREEDPKIHRRRLLFELHLHELKGE